MPIIRQSPCHNPLEGSEEAITGGSFSMVRMKVALSPVSSTMKPRLQRQPTCATPQASGLELIRLPNDPKPIISEAIMANRSAG